jgi:hypothetical protein
MATPTINNTSAVVEQLGALNPAGTTMGASSASLLSVYGVTPVTQAAAITNTGTDAAGNTATLASIITALKNFGITA